VDVLGTAGLEFRIALLPPISRGVHLDGPRLHAERLIEAWAADGEVALGQAFRLLDVETVAGVILRTVTANEYEGDPRHWHFPPLADLLPPLREQAWQEILAGRLMLKAIKGERGKQYRTLAPAELVRLTPDWEVARLTRDGRDEHVDTRVRRRPAIKPTWRRDRIPGADLEGAMEEIASAHEGRTPPYFDDVLKELRRRFGEDLPRDTVRGILNNYPQLKRKRGQT
jgi:hypothetical protein